MKLLKLAAQTMNNAHAPYSKFKVGCAVIGGSGKVYVGCNVENASFSATICAERTAITQAIAQGETEIKELAIINSTKEPCAPCGVCLQFMTEFAKDLTITSASSDLKKTKKYRLKDLLPETYDKKFLKK